jgi:hypothetical protein
MFGIRHHLEISIAQGSVAIGGYFAPISNRLGKTETAITSAFCNFNLVLILSLDSFSPWYPLGKTSLLEPYLLGN